MANIKETLAQLKLLMEVDFLFAEKLEELEHRIYFLEQENLARKGATRSLDSRYSELLMVLSEIRQELKKK